MNLCLFCKYLTRSWTVNEVLQLRRFQESQLLLKLLRYICWKLLILLLNCGNLYCSSIAFINQSNRFEEERPFSVGKLALEMGAQSAGSPSEGSLLPRSLCGESKGLFPAQMIAEFHLHVGQVPQLCEEGQ